MSRPVWARIDPYAERPDHGPVRFLYRLNPLSKIAAPLPAVIALLFARDIWMPLVCIVGVLLLLCIGARLTGRTLLALLVGVPVSIGVLSLSLGLWTDPRLALHTPVVLQLGAFEVRAGSLALGLATALRLVALLALTLPSALTTTGPDLVRAMIQQLRVPYRMGYTTLAAYRFVPRFGTELDHIRQAHRVRGMAGGRGPIAGLRRYGGYVVPLLAGAIRHAERVALAMDSRGFGAYSTRTERYRIPFRTRDWVFIVLFWVGTALLLACTWVGIFPQ